MSANGKEKRSKNCPSFKKIVSQEERKKNTSNATDRLSKTRAENCHWT